RSDFLTDCCTCSLRPPSLLCEIYEVKSEASDVKYIVYAASVATAMFDEIHTAPLPDKKLK
ncbi:MAG: hypothetical protein RR222_23095, partial [Pseudomonas sp.]